MPTPSPAILVILATFALAFTTRSFVHAQVLVYGTLLAAGWRTVTAALRAVGKRQVSVHGEQSRFRLGSPSPTVRGEERCRARTGKRQVSVHGERRRTCWGILTL